MKMSKDSYEYILSKFQEHKEVIQEHYEDVKTSGRYNVLEDRVAWDCAYAFLDRGFITEQYKKDLNDRHLKTAFVKALKEVL